MADLTMNRLPWWGQMAVFAVLGLAAGGAFFYYYDVPAQERLRAQEAEVAAARGRIDKGLATARQLPAFKGQVAELEGRLVDLRAILPEEKDVADLLRRIQTIATQSDLRIRGFKPQPMARRRLHAEWPISLELDGTYHNVGLFLDRVSKFPRIINVGGITMQSSSDQSSTGASVAVSCTATTFVMVEAAPAPAPASGAPPGGKP